MREVLKTVEMRRQLLLRGAAEDLTTEQLLKIWRVFEEGAILAARIANTVFLPVAQATGAEVEKGRAYAAEAEADTRAGRYGDALRNRVMAVVANPQDADSREWITDLGFALQEVEIEDPLAETRGSIVVAFLEELEKEPQLLAAYAEAVGEDDDITLAVDAAGVEEGVALVRIEHVLRNAGLDPTTVPDVVLVAMDAANAKSQAKAIKVELERRAEAEHPLGSAAFGRRVLHRALQVGLVDVEPCEPPALFGSKKVRNIPLSLLRPRSAWAS